MKELFRERDYTRIGFYQSMLESEGIPTFVRNQDLVTMTTDIPIPEFFPALCVVNDEDYEVALEVLRSHVEAVAEEAAARGDETEAESEVPFEMRGIVLAGVVLVVGMFMAGALALMADPLRRDPDLRGILFLAATFLAGGVGIVRSVQLFLATRRRRRSPDAKDGS